MPATSKPSVPSLADITLMYIAFQLPMLKSNAQSWKPGRLNLIPRLNCSPLVQRSGNLVPYSHKNKCQKLVLKEVPNSNPLQKLNNLDIYEYVWIRILTYIWTVLLSQNMLGVLHSQKPAITGSVFLQVSLEREFAKYPGRFNKFRKIRKTSDICSQQMPTATSRFSKCMEYFHVSPEASARFLDQFNLQMPLQTRFLKNLEQGKLPKVTVPIGAPNELVLQNIDDYKRRAEMRCQGMCCVCQEKVAEKKFFGERRYGILSDCDCMICYGCILKTVGKDGWVKESVVCPVCSVKSDTFASRHKWIEGQEKISFFQTFKQNMGIIGGKEKLGFFQTCNENIGTAKTTIKNRSDMKRERIYSEPEEKQLINCLYLFCQIFI